VPKTQEDIQERARKELVQKAIRINRAANRSNKSGKTVKKKSGKKTRSLVDPVVADDPDTLPPIMQRRVNNIARNNEVLATLGLLHRGTPLPHYRLKNHRPPVVRLRLATKMKMTRRMT
jgi:hypothetical protein